VNWPRVLRQVIAPVASAYLMFLAVFVWYAIRRSGSLPRQRLVERANDLAWLALIRRLVLTLAGAYLVFAAIIAIFYLVLGDQPRNFVPESLTQGAVLAFGVVLPAFLLLTWAEAGWHRRRRSRRGGPAPTSSTE
jgi:hypothetical protein